MHESQDHTMLSVGETKFFGENDLFDPCDPYMTFDPKLVMSQVRVHTLNLLLWPKLVKIGCNMSEILACWLKQKQKQKQKKKKRKLM